MGDLIAFAKRVKEQLDRANHEPQWSGEEADRYMEEVKLRRQRYVELAAQLMATVIQPRLEVITSYFPHSSPGRNDPEWHCSYWFGFTERFPASAKLSFGVEHDSRFEQVMVTYDVSMVPVFVKFNEHDKLIGALDNLAAEKVATWVEQRIVDFLDAYLQLDRGRDDFIEEPATDPVCGMRIIRSTAAASTSYRGHPYFFCNQSCLDQFSANPLEFVKVKTM
jgi:YHS domain-containing protein